MQLSKDIFFQDDCNEIVEIQSSYAVAKTKKDQFFEAAVIQNQQEQQLQQSINKVNHHRRYMSDTSGFKRYVLFFF